MYEEARVFDEIDERLAELEQLGLSRRLRLVSGPQGPTILLNGQPVLLLCSNNYLGLADHPQVRKAAADAAMRWGVGAGASRLISGTMTVHRRLEERLAEFTGREACLLFGSGYLANLGVIGALAGSGDTVFSDELNHASIIDGCRLSRAEVVVYRHGDPEHLLWSMRRAGGGRREGAGRRLVVTDSIFSMDGDVAPLEQIVELAQAAGGRVVVDEAHAIGTFGPDGRGALAQAGLEGEVDAIVGTLGKSLGSYGAYVCGDEQMMRYLLNTARSFIFSTAPPPPAAAGALAALELLAERPHRVERLHANARALRRALALEGFAVSEGEMHIVPLVVGDERATMRLCQAAIEQGVFAQAIRPPTVAAGSSRLRLAAMASHTASDMRLAAEVLAKAARKLGLDPAEIGSPEPEPVAVEEPTPVAAGLEAPEHKGAYAGAAGGTAPPSAPFDVEAPRPRRPPAPADAAQGSEGVPFDGERDGAIAHAA
ncbi:MAG TPA: 8-amino-7-oxononanoate synthase [Solirubrobacteraceae bacterium]|jgi:glycine C-acetyltransferase/8-amino-7-oxononanoate synthase|nr:8-amino-7-oxononanoate synthase [Solirubrobacteraceae bacterium]